MTRDQIEGMRRFERVGCTKCHNGPMFSDYKVHVLGVPDNSTLPRTDRGMQVGEEREAPAPIFSPANQAELWSAGNSGGEKETKTMTPVPVEQP